jgi:two-component system chemotaxis response regulator CheB
MESTEHPLRVLIVDDTVTYRKIVASTLADCPDVEVVGTAANGKIALQRIEQLFPDLLVLDLEMPEMNGLELLEELRRRRSDVGAIMLSAFTAEGAKTTIAALERGAFDFVTKPANGSFAENSERMGGELRSKLTAYARRKGVSKILYGTSAAPSRAPGVPAPNGRQGPPPPQAGQGAVQALASPALPSAPRLVSAPAGPPQVVVLGISTGGPRALTEMLPQLPADLPVPLLIVQHMPPVFTRSLADDLDKRCALAVREAEDGAAISAGQIWIAPGGRQMKVQRDGEQTLLRITDDPPENSCRPSVDYLFRSVAEAFGGRAVGVIMTGMGSDGALGCRWLKDRGAAIIAQDEASCVVFGMPREPIEKGIADVVAPLDRIAGEIARLARKGVPACR